MPHKDNQICHKVTWFIIIDYKVIGQMLTMIFILCSTFCTNNLKKFPNLVSISKHFFIGPMIKCLDIETKLGNFFKLLVQNVEQSMKIIVAYICLS